MPDQSLESRAWETSLAAARANTLASSTAMVQHLNRELANRYNAAFDSWRTSVLAGKIDNLNPPLPPNGYMLMTSQDGFAFPELGPDLVCEPRADIPADYSKPQVVALPEPAHIRNVPPGDTTPEGFVVIADGQRWQKQSSVTPFGVAYFYQRV